MHSEFRTLMAKGFLEPIKPKFGILKEKKLTTIIISQLENGLRKNTTLLRDFLPSGTCIFLTNVPGFYFL